MNVWSLLQLIAPLIGVFDPGSPQAQKVGTIIADLSSFGAAVAAGFEPPTSLSNIAGDIKLLVDSAPPDVQAQIPKFADVQAAIAQYTTWETDLDNGQPVRVASGLVAPTPKQTKCSVLMVPENSPDPQLLRYIGL